MKYKVLVNKNNRLKDNYLSKIKLVSTLDVDLEEVKVEEETYKAYLKLKDDLKKENIEIGISSAYRSLEHQQKVYDEFCLRYGKEYADKIVAPVGHSEHHTALAIDLNIKKDGKWCQDNASLMQEEATFQKIAKILHLYGFILRYPKGKEEITGYPYEPWHIRYVTNPLASIIYENNYTLEEYFNFYSGVIIVNKEKDMTSFDVTNEISKILGIKKIGHTGTLDPLAEGVLVVTINSATKIAEIITATYKEYIASVTLGLKTDTLDITGKIVETSPVPENLNLEKTLESFPKTYLQEVPAYSAVKVNGKKLYEYARRNEPVTLPKKEVTIKEIALLSKTANTFTFRALVSKGCYIRSLIRDLGQSLNTYATMTSLTRTKQGKFSLSDACSLEDIKNNNFKLLAIPDVLDYKTVTVDSKTAFKIKNGCWLDNIYNIEDKVIFKDENAKLLGIYYLDNDKLKVWKNFS